MRYKHPHTAHIERLAARTDSGRDLFLDIFFGYALERHAGAPACSWPPQCVVEEVDTGQLRNVLSRDVFRISLHDEAALPDGASIARRRR